MREVVETLNSAMVDGEAAALKESKEATRRGHVVDGWKRRLLNEKSFPVNAVRGRPSLLVLVRLNVFISASVLEYIAIDDGSVEELAKATKRR